MSAIGPKELLGLEAKTGFMVGGHHFSSVWRRHRKHSGLGHATFEIFLFGATALESEAFLKRESARLFERHVIRSERAKIKVVSSGTRGGLEILKLTETDKNKQGSAILYQQASIQLVISL